MKLPASISPNFIVEVVADVRFDSAMPEEAILGSIYIPLQKDFPKLTTLPLASVPPEARRQNPQLFSQPLHQLEGEHLTLSVGPHTFAMSADKEYPGWAALSAKFRDTFARVAPLGFIGRSRRFGLRYVSFFEYDVFPNLALSIQIDGEAVAGQGTAFRTTLRGNGCDLLLQVNKDVMLVSKPDRRGSVIDIDTSVGEPDIEDNLEAAFAVFLEKAHAAQKVLFFKLLRPEFLKTLRPLYADN